MKHLSLQNIFFCFSGRLPSTLNDGFNKHPTALKAKLVNESALLWEHLQQPRIRLKIKFQPLLYFFSQLKKLMKVAMYPRSSGLNSYFQEWILSGQIT